MLSLVLSKPVSPSLLPQLLCHRRFRHKQTFWQRPPRKVPSPLARTGNLSRGSDPSAQSWAVQCRMMASNREHWAAKPSHLLALLTHPTHSQGDFPRETHLTHSYIQAVVIHGSLCHHHCSARPGGCTGSCSHTAPAEAHVPLLKGPDTPANILNLPSPTSFVTLPLPPPLCFIFLTDTFP